MSPLLPPPESLLPPPESLLLLGIGAGSSGCSAVPQSSRGSLRFAGEDESAGEVTWWPCTPAVPFRGVPHQPGAQHGGRVALPLRLSPPGQAVVPRYHFMPRTSKHRGLFTSFGAARSSLSQLCPWPAWPPAPPFPLPPFPSPCLFPSGYCCCYTSPSQPFLSWPSFLGLDLYPRNLERCIHLFAEEQKCKMSGVFPADFTT